MPARRKLVTDLPQFRVTTVKRREDEHATSDLSGSFDKSEGVRDGMCWLLLPGQESYYGRLSSFHPEAKTAEFQTHVEGNPTFEGKSFCYLSGYWQAYHIWMVADENHAWEQVTFRSSDAASDTVQDGGGKTLRRLRKATPQDFDNPGLKIVPGGWDHEHCELCWAHIGPGDACFRDGSDHWVCVQCYERYVKNHDLSFVDDL